jgi:ATP-dependent helicase/DNAse subunit B
MVDRTPPGGLAGSEKACRVGAPVWEPMPITLITGPANAGKAHELLQAVRAHVARGQEPLLVVPTRADLEHYRRELAADGLVLGVRVQRFRELLDELILRAGVRERVLSPLARERALAAVLGHATGQGAHDSHNQDDPQISQGYVRALAAFVAELEVERVSPRRLREALDAWAAQDQTRRPRAARLSSLFEDYHGLLRKIGRADPEHSAVRALDAVRRAPALWGSTPVLFYGFDDLTRLQLDAIETLGRLVDAPVMVSLAYESGRMAFAGRAGAFQTLLPLAHEHRALQSRAEHYAQSGRTALHHLERALFETDRPRLESDGAVRLLAGGSERAELELVAAEIKGLLDRGVEPGEIALVHRAPVAVAELLGEVLVDAEVPFSMHRRLPLAHTAVGRALLGLLRSACGGVDGLPAGSSEDLLDWLRAPGLLARPELADRLEARARRTGVSSAAATRALWASEHWPLDTIDHVREAAARGSVALLERLARELQWLFHAPRRASASVLAGADLDEAGALKLLSGVLRELRELARAAPVLAPNARELVVILAGLELHSGEAHDTQTVAILDPLALRARRVRALFLCGLQEGVFPAPTHPEPLLAAEERRGLAEVSGLRLARHEDVLAAERYLLYATVSRPEELLVLSWHTADDDGAPSSPSLFVEDVCDLFAPSLREGCLGRSLGAADWPGPGEPPVRFAERELALAAPREPIRPLAPLRDELLLAELEEGRMWSASSLEVWAGCPVRWFVQRLLRAEDLDPEPEPLARGALAHAALKDTLEGLKLQTGSAMLLPEHLGLARGLLRAALSAHAEEFPLSVAPERVPGVGRRLQADLERYLEHAAGQQSSLEPTYLELSFGFPEEQDGVAAYDLGEGLLVRGRIDRVDVGVGGEAVVYDYKGRNAPEVGKWAAEQSFQVAIYMRAVEQVLQLRAVGGFYQPLAGRDLRARGLLDADAELLDDTEAPGLESVAADVREHPEFESLLQEAVGLARQAARQARAGALQARPDSCAYGGGCSYPTICRCER